jgi:hypothetical protein
MDNLTNELLQEISAAMERMPNDPRGVAGWLLSNYKFTKIGDAIPTEKFHRKGNGNQEVDESKIKIDPDYEKFLKRTDVHGKVLAKNPTIEKFKKNKNGKIAELAKAITGVEDPYGEDISATSDDEPIEVSSEDQRAYLDLKKAGFDPFEQLSTSAGGITDLSQVISAQDIVNLQSQNDEELLLPQEAALASTSEGTSVLQKNRYKKIKAQEAFENGGGVFRR